MRGIQATQAKQQQTTHTPQTTPQNDFRIFRIISLKILEMRGLGDLRGPYDATKKCIIDDKSTSSQEDENFLIYHLRSTLLLLINKTMINQ